MNTTEMDPDRLITLAIHTFEYATTLKHLLESEGIEVELNNVNLSNPVVSSGVRVRIHEKNLPQALRIVENRHIFSEATDFCAEKRIVLVPTDFSSHSLLAIDTAFRLAKLHNCEIVFLHTFIDPALGNDPQLSDVYSYDSSQQKKSEKLEKKEKELMAGFLSGIREKIKNGQLPAVRFGSIVVEGIPEEAIFDYTRQNNPFLLVMATRDAESKERDLVGSVAAEVLDNCRSTTVTIPSNISDERLLDRIGKIVFFANLDQTDLIALDTLFRIIPGMFNNVVITHLPVRKDWRINVDTELKKLERYCRSNYPHCNFSTLSISGGQFPGNLADDSSLVVVSNRKKNILARLVNPGIAHKLLFRTDIPMVAIPV